MIDLDELHDKMISYRLVGFTRSDISTIDALEILGRLQQAEKDAARYRWLRDCKWNESNLCVVTEPKVSVKLGTDCPSSDRLDAAIDEDMQCNK